MYILPEICKIKTNVGLGDIIYLKQLLDDTKHLYKSIQITPNTETISSTKNDFVNHFKFLYNIFYDLFLEDPYEIVYSPEFSGLSLNHGSYISFLNTVFGIKVQPKIPNLEKYFCKKIYPKNNNILITTKVRGIHISEYENIKNNFYTLLNQIGKKYNLILIGERQIGINPEYKRLDNKELFTIYEDLIKYLKNYQDKTTTSMTDVTPDYSDFLEDCSIMNSSKKVITLGFGGNVAMAMSVSEIINFYGNNHNTNHEHLMYYKLMENASDKKILTSDPYFFYSKLEELT